MRVNSEMGLYYELLFILRLIAKLQQLASYV